MPLSITANAAAATAHRNLGTANNEAQRSISKISSGQRVFSAKEDAAALSIGTGLQKEVSALRAASINAQSGISLMQIADGALGQMTEILGRLESLTTQSASDSLSSIERGFLDVEFQNLKAEMDRIASTTEFNGVSLLGGVNDVVLNTAGANVDTDDGFVGFDFQDFVNPASVFEVSYDDVSGVMTMTNQATSVYQSIAVQSPTVGRLLEYNFSQLGVTLTLNSNFDDTVPLVYAGAGEEFDVNVTATATASVYEFQMGSTTAAEDRIIVNLPLINVDQMGLTASNVLTFADAIVAKTNIQNALSVISSSRSALGANMNRMEIASNNIQVSIENAETSRSALLDVDVASEITNMSAQQILLEAGTSMLTRANEIPRTLLGLIRG